MISVKFYQLVDRARDDGLIDTMIWKFIRTPHPRISNFYSLPKLHKEGPELKGRPIISGTGNLTEIARKLVDRSLKPHVETLFSFVRDTLSFLQAMDGITTSRHSHLVTIDVECLYNSIPHQRGLEVVASYLEQMDAGSASYNGFILELLEFILNNDVFLFDGVPLLQVQGVGMGTPCAPAYANLYLRGVGTHHFF